MFNWERDFLTFLTSLRFLLGNLESEASHDSARAKEGQTKSAESDADMTEPHDGTKRSAESGVSPEKKKKWSLAHPLLATVKRLSNDGQGNCLFESVAEGLKLTGGGTIATDLFRAAAASHLKRHRDKYFLFWDHKDTMDKTMPDTTNF